MKKLLLLILVISIIGCNHKKGLPTCDVQPIQNNYNGGDKFGFKPYHNINIAIQCSKNTGRPILLMFTGLGCISYPGIDWKILADKDIKSLIDENYILTVLYCDDNRQLDIIDSTKKTIDGKIIKTISDENVTFQITRFNKNSQPYYLFLDSDLNKIAEPLGYTPLERKAEFIKHLKTGIEKNKNKDEN